MITLEINPQTLTDAILSLDEQGVTTLREWLIHSWERDDDVMMTAWGDICEDDLSPHPISGEPWTIVHILRLFCDTPERNFLEGAPCDYLAEVFGDKGAPPGYEIDLIATADTMRGWVAGLASLRAPGDCLSWDVASASRRLYDEKTKDRHILPLPPAHIRVQRVESAEN